MAFVTWSERYSVRIRRFDEDHQQLFGIVNELHENMKKGHGKDVLESVLTKLLTYTKEHFAREESALKTYGYPEAKCHLAQHAAFADKVNGFVQEYKTGTGGLSAEVLSFITEWLTSHIMACDHQYGEFLKAKGMA
jgi:hemerythrin-like metal-binding protein